MRRRRPAMQTANPVPGRFARCIARRVPVGVREPQSPILLLGGGGAGRHISSLKERRGWPRDGERRMTLGNEERSTPFIIVNAQGKNLPACARNQNETVMKKNLTSMDPEAETENIVEDAESLLEATAHIAEEKVAEARRRLSAALDRGREAWETVQDRAISGAKATDQVIRDHPYQSLGIALGLGVLVGFLLNRRGSR